MAGVTRRALHAGIVLVGLAATCAAVAAPLQSSRALLARLRATGRAEADVTLKRTDPDTGRPRATRGRLALELPGRARLEFPSTGEALTLRDDGGEWLQPGPRQLLRAGVRSASGAMMWWAALLDSGGMFREEPLGNRGYRLTPREGDASESQQVWLGARGLPARLEITTGSGESQQYVLTNWRFSRPRGRQAFVLDAPSGYETVDLP